MTDEVNLKQTASTGKYVPIFLNTSGEIVDGEHRRNTDPKWPTLKTRIAPGLETHIARLIINTQRRDAAAKDYNECAEYLQKKEKSDKPYRASGKSIAERIAEETGISKRTVLEHLDDKYKQPQEKVADTATLGKGEQIRVPKAMVKEVRDLVETVKLTAKTSPKLKHEIIRTTRLNLRRNREALDQAQHMPSTIRPFVESGKLTLEHAKLILAKAPEPFVEEAAKKIAAQKMKLLDAEAYLVSQQPSYRTHMFAGSKLPVQRSGTLEADFKFGPPLPFLKLEEMQVLDVRDGSIWLRDDNGVEVSLHEKIKQDVSKMDVSKIKPRDRLTLSIVVVPLIVESKAPELEAA